MGEINQSEHLLAEGTDGAIDTATRELPTRRAWVHGLPLGIGLKSVPFLIGTGPTPTDELTECSFEIPMRHLGPNRVRVDVPTELVEAWGKHIPATLADSVAGFRQDLEEADRKQEQTVRVADHMAAIIEMALRCMGDKARAIEVIPETGLSIGELMASAVAWWDQERDQDRAK